LTTGTFLIVVVDWTELLKIVGVLFGQFVVDLVSKLIFTDVFVVVRHYSQNSGFLLLGCLCDRTLNDIISKLVCDHFVQIIRISQNSDHLILEIGDIILKALFNNVRRVFLK